MNPPVSLADDKQAFELHERQIVERIFTAVMEQRLVPKTKLSEAALCEAFGVGRMRVRRALLLLANQGIVDLKSNKGAFVACPDSRDAKEVFDARCIIEPGIVRALCIDMSEDAQVRLARHLEKENDARVQDGRTELIRLFGEFHIELAKATENSFLIKQMRELIARTSLIVGLFGKGRQSTCPEDEHHGILLAIFEKEPEAAVRMMVRHLRHIEDALDLTVTSAGQYDIADILRI